MDPWAQITALRTELIDELTQLPDERWDEPTLCAGWRVRDVIAHTILPERMSLPGLLGGLVRSGFSLTRFIHEDAVRRGSAPLPELVASYRAAIGRRTLPPTRSVEHLLTDLFIHAQDIRRPIGLTWSHGSELLGLVAGTVCADKAGGAPKRLADLRLAANDIGWSTGTGAEITGTAEALILAASGRTVALGELSGPGVETLTARLN